MLESLRKNSGGLVAKIFIGLIAISFAIWGVGDMFRGGSPRDLARVGDTAIDVEVFRQLYQERLQQLGSRIGRSITPDQARAMGLDRQLLGEVISETALDERAKELGLRIDDQTLLARIHANPAFQGADGNFDPNRFYETLRNAGFSEARYVDAERRLVLRQQIGRALTGGTEAPEVLRDALRRFQNEERAVQFVELGQDQAGDIPAPSQAEIEAYFKENAAAFRAPEYRKLIVLALTPESIADEIEISDKEVKETYENIRNRLGKPERREIDQIVVNDEEQAKAIADRLASGATFDEIAKERKLEPKDVSLGLVSRAQILDEPVADSVFALPVGEVSKPIKGRFGTVFARVNKIEPGQQPSFEEMADTIRRDLALRRARSVILDRHDKIEDERAAGSRLGEIAGKVGAKSFNIDAIDRSGRGPDGKPIENVPGLQAVLEEAFVTDPGVEADPVEIGQNGGYAWFEVLEVTPSRDRTLEEARPRVEERWREEQVAKRLAERAEGIKAKLDAGESFETAALGLAVQTREKIKRGGNVEGLGRGAIGAIFETAEGRSGTAIKEDGTGRVVFRVTSVNVPAGEPDQELVADLNLGIQDDILVQYVMNLQNRLGVQVNPEALQNVTGGSSGF